MLEAMFGFRGRLGRLSYFLRTLALSGATGVAMVLVAVVAMVGHPPTNMMQTLGTLALFGLPVLIGYLWSAFSLQARRIRDIGWEPWVVLPTWMGAELIASVLARVAPPLMIIVLVIFHLASLVMGGCLLFWPGRADGGATPDAPRKAAKPAKPMQPAPVLRAAPVWGVDIPRTSFGRRGV